MEKHPTISRVRSASPARGRHVAAIAGLALVVLLTHGGSLFDGLFFDDYWHRHTLQSYGWGFQDLVESATFNLPGRLVHLWWQDQPLQWRYARPVAMFFMKIEVLLSCGNPVGVHAFALGWHWIATSLVYLLAFWAAGKRSIAFIGAALFAFQPHSVFAVSWIAARNALIGGCLAIAAVYAYVRESTSERGAAEKIRLPWLFAALGLWLLSLFSRETAIIVPLLFLVLDWSEGGSSRVRQRLGVYVVTGVLGLAYLYWRLVLFPVAGPPGIYYTTPSGISYVPWALSKLLQMVFALVCQTPMFLGLATYSGLGAVEIVTHVVMLLLVGLFAAWYFVSRRNVRAPWLWPVWVVAGFIPVIPVFIMPHFAYLPAAGLAVMFAALLARAGRKGAFVVGILLVVFSLWSFEIYRYVWRGIVRSEQLVYADIHAQTPSLDSGAKLILIDLPIAGIYAGVAMREAWEQPELDAYVLSFAPHPLMMTQRTTVRAVDEHTLELATEPPGYFSGMSGAMLIDGMRGGVRLEAGQTLAGEVFDTTIVEATDAGVTRLRFRFHKPLESGAYLFFRSTPQDAARRLRIVNGIVTAERPPDSPQRRAWLRERKAFFDILNFTARIVRSDLYLTGERDD